MRELAGTSYLPRGPPPQMVPRYVDRHRVAMVPDGYRGPLPPMPAELRARLPEYATWWHRRRIAHHRLGIARAQIGKPPVPHFAAQRLPFSTAKGASGGLVYEVPTRATSASALTPTQQNEMLVGVWLEGGQAPGAWEFLFDGVHQAIFPVGGSGLDATGAIGPETVAWYPLNYGPIGTNIPAAVQTYGGGLAALYPVFSNIMNPMGHRISAFTGVYVEGNESGTSGTSRTYSIPGALGKPTAIIAQLAITVGTATGFPVGQIIFPAIGNYSAFLVPAELSRGHEASQYRLWAVPDYDAAASFSLTHKAITLAAATDVGIGGSLYYSQGLQPVAKA